jgi:histone deacetylase complex regulatory component SIN3
MKKKRTAKLDMVDRLIIHRVAQLLRNYPDLRPQFRRFLDLATKGRLKESTAAARSLRDEIERRQAA